jgi:hypothetical protein
LISCLWRGGWEIRWMTLESYMEVQEAHGHSDYNLQQARVGLFEYPNVVIGCANKQTSFSFT